MPRVESAALVLTIRDFRESSVLVDLLTPGMGRVGAIARGARRPRSPLGAALQPFALLRATLAIREAGGLATLAAADPVHQPAYAPRPGDFSPQIADSLARYAYAGLLAEVLAAGLENDPHGAGLFEFAQAFFMGLENTAHPGSFALAATWGIIARLGYTPHLDERVSPSARRDAPYRLDVLEGRLREPAEPASPHDYLLTSAQLRTLVDLVQSDAPDPGGLAPAVSRGVGRPLMTIAMRLLETHLEKRLRSIRFIEEMILSESTHRGSMP